MLNDDDAVQMFDGKISMEVRDSAGNTSLQIMASRRSQTTAAGDTPFLTADAPAAPVPTMDCQTLKDPASRRSGSMLEDSYREVVDR